MDPFSSDDDPAFLTDAEWSLAVRTTVQATTVHRVKLKTLRVARLSRKTLNVVFPKLRFQGKRSLNAFGADCVCLLGWEEALQLSSFSSPKKGGPGELRCTTPAVLIPLSASEQQPTFEKRSQMPTITWQAAGSGMWLWMDEHKDVQERPALSAVEVQLAFIHGNDAAKVGYFISALKEYYEVAFKPLTAWKKLRNRASKDEQASLTGIVLRLAKLALPAEDVVGCVASMATKRVAYDKRKTSSSRPSARLGRSGAVGTSRSRQMVTTATATARMKVGSLCEDLPKPGRQLKSRNFATDSVFSPSSRLPIPSSRRFQTTRLRSVAREASRKSRQSHLLAPYRSPARSVSTAYRSRLNSGTGFRNIGNTCYLNAVMQAMLGKHMAPHFHPALHHVAELQVLPRDAFLLQLAELTKRLSQSSGSSGGVVDLGKLKSTIGKRYPRFAGNEQQDAHEFFNNVVQELEESLERAMLNQWLQLNPLKEDKANGAVVNMVDSDDDDIDGERKSSESPPSKPDRAAKAAKAKAERLHRLRGQLETVDELQACSPVTAAFQGFLLHTLTCTDCGYSREFLEAFTSLSLFFDDEEDEEEVEEEEEGEEEEEEGDEDKPAGPSGKSTSVPSSPSASPSPAKKPKLEMVKSDELENSTPDDADEDTPMLPPPTTTTATTAASHPDIPPPPFEYAFCDEHPWVKPKLRRNASERFFFLRCDKRHEVQQSPSRSDTGLDTSGARVIKRITGVDYDELNVWHREHAKAYMRHVLKAPESKPSLPTPKKPPHTPSSAQRERLRSKKRSRKALFATFTKPKPKNVELEALLARFLSPHTIEYRCEKCDNSLVESTTRLHTAPKTLVLHVKRFCFSMKALNYEKISTPVAISEHLRVRHNGALGDHPEDAAAAAKQVLKRVQALVAEEDPENMVDDDSDESGAFEDEEPVELREKRAEAASLQVAVRETMEEAEELSREAQRLSVGMNDAPPSQREQAQLKYVVKQSEVVAAQEKVQRLMDDQRRVEEELEAMQQQLLAEEDEDEEAELPAPAPEKRVSPTPLEGNDRKRQRVAVADSDDDDDEDERMTPVESAGSQAEAAAAAAAASASSSASSSPDAKERSKPKRKPKVASPQRLGENVDDEMRAGVVDSIKSLPGEQTTDFDIGLGASASVYQLKAVVHHHGRGAFAGHYTTTAVDDKKQWHKFDDSRVRECDDATAFRGEQAKRTSYMLFFVRDDGTG